MSNGTEDMLGKMIAVFILSIIISGIGWLRNKGRRKP